MGGQTDQLTQMISQSLEQGSTPEEVISSLTNSNVSEEDIENAFVQLGYVREDIQNIMSNLNQFMQDMSGMPTAQYGMESAINMAGGNTDLLKAFISNMNTSENNIDLLNSFAGNQDLLRAYISNMQAPNNDSLQDFVKNDMPEFNFGVTPKDLLNNPDAYRDDLRDDLYERMTPESNEEERKNKKFSYPKLATQVVGAAGIINDIFDLRKANEAKETLYDMTQADMLYDAKEMTPGRKGYYDINTGLLQQDQYVPYMAQQGTETQGMNPMYLPDLVNYVMLNRDYSPEILENLSDTQRTRRQELLDAANTVSEGNPNLKRLLTMTGVMENTLGADPNAYGRDYTRSPMSIDSVAYDDVFNIREGATDYTTQQKKNQQWLDDLGLDHTKMDSLLTADNPMAAMAAARLVYGRSPEAIPSGLDQNALYNYYISNYNKGGLDKYGGAEKHRKRFKEYFDKMYNYQSPEEPTPEPVEEPVRNTNVWQGMENVQRNILQGYLNEIMNLDFQSGGESISTNKIYESLPEINPLSEDAFPGFRYPYSDPPASDYRFRSVQKNTPEILKKVQDYLNQGSDIYSAVKNVAQKHNVDPKSLLEDANLFYNFYKDNELAYQKQFYGTYGRDMNRARVAIVQTRSEPAMKKERKMLNRQEPAGLYFMHFKDIVPQYQSGGEVEVDSNTLAALIAAGADIEML